MCWIGCRPPCPPVPDPLVETQVMQSFARIVRPPTHGGAVVEIHGVRDLVLRAPVTFPSGRSLSFYAQCTLFAARALRLAAGGGTLLLSA